MSGFLSFVESKFGNDPYRCANYFFNELESLANSVGIDWYKTSTMLKLDGVMLKGGGVSVVSADDAYRVSCVGYSNKFTLSGGGVVYWPLIRFRNHRASRPDGWIDFNGLDHMFKLYEAGKRGEIRDPDSTKTKVGSSIVVPQKVSSHEAQRKDLEWFNRLDVLNTPCPYFELEKRLSLLHVRPHVKTGSTNAGPFQGIFTALPLFDLRSSLLDPVAMWRVYHNGFHKVFKKGINTDSLAFVLMPKVDLSRYSPGKVFVLESAANALVAFTATYGMYPAISCMFSENIPKQAGLIRERFPEAELVFVPDNDVKLKNNPGVLAVYTAVESVSPPCSVKVPVFADGEDDCNNDLWDYFNRYGIGKVRDLLDKY